MDLSLFWYELEVFVCEWQSNWFNGLHQIAHSIAFRRVFFFEGGGGLAAGELPGFIYPSQVHHYFSPLHFVFWPMPWSHRLTRTSWRHLGCLSLRKFMLGWWNVQYQTDWHYQIAQLMALFTGDSALVREWYSWEFESRTGLAVMFSPFM